MSLSPEQFGAGHTIEHVTVTQHGDDHYKVKVGSKTKAFKGESAWSDAQRHANDALTEKRGPFGPSFYL
jgi:hypothetical protein